MSIFKSKRKDEKNHAETQRVEATKEKTTHIVSAKTLLKRPHQSEKSVNLNHLNKFTFVVETSANKSELKKEIERRYGVKVVGINAIRMKGKNKRFGNKMGKLPMQKKVIFTLKSGQKIEIGT